MATASITRYSVAPRTWPRLGSSGAALAALGAPEGPAVDLTLDGTPRHMPAATAAGLYRIVTIGSAARIAIGTDAVATATAEYWPAGMVEVRYLRKGERISVLGAA